MSPPTGKRSAASAKKRGSNNNALSAEQQQQPKKKSKSNAEESKDAAADHATNENDYKPPLTLGDISERIQQLIDQVPSYSDTASLKVSELESLEAWCRTVRYVIRRFNLVLHFVRPSTYQWAPDRSGHSEQNLGALNKEVSYASSALNFIANNVNDVLTPTLTKQLTKCVKTTDGNVKTTDYTYTPVVDDEEMLQLDRQHLCNEAVDKRALLIVVMQKMHKALGDYIKESDNNERMPMTY